MFDLSVSFVGLVLTSPITVPTAIAVWMQDWHSPFYVAPRVARGGGIFKMVKMRSMVVNADKSGVDSTGAGDRRITAVGHFIRRYKIDELTQLWNVFTGDMSLVGPRPNVKRETDLYTPVEQRLLSVKPGITDFASIVFADEGDILQDKVDPDIAYNQLIRPWKSRLALLNVQHSSFLLDLKVVALTALAILSREKALKGIQVEVAKLTQDQSLIRIAGREEALVPTPPPGSDEIVTTRDQRVRFLTEAQI
ncbi:MAG: sugar transferase [Bdellovibrionales bacterium]